MNKMIILIACLTAGLQFISTNSDAATAPNITNAILKQRIPGLETLPRGENRVSAKDLGDGSMLAVLIRYPAYPKDARTIPALNAELLRRYETGEQYYRDQLRSEDWASLYYLRATYMALQTYYQIVRDFPAEYVGMAPVAMDYVNGEFILDYEVEPPPALVTFDVSPITFPDAYRSSSCGTCGSNVRPFVFVNSYAFAGYSCSYSGDHTAERRWNALQIYTPYYETYNKHVETKLDMAQLAKVNNSAPTYSLPSDFSGGPLNGEFLYNKSCLGMSIYFDSSGKLVLDSKGAYGKKMPRIPADAKLVQVQFPVAGTGWLEKGLKSAKPEDFLDPEKGYPNWGGYLDWMRDVAVTAAKRTVEIPGAFDNRAMLSHLYDIPEAWPKNSENNIWSDRSTSVFTIERRFLAESTARWAKANYYGEFGTAFRKMLSEEVAVQKRSNRAMLAMLLTAGLTGAVNGMSGGPLNLSQLTSQASQIVTSGTAGLSENQRLLASTSADFASDATGLGASRAHVTASNLEELRGKLRALLLQGVQGKSEAVE